VDINHPDQYYTITKEKGNKMPRFNTESNEYRVTFNELNVQSVPDIFHEPLRVHVITSLSSSTLRKADVCYIQLYTMVQDELFAGMTTKPKIDGHEQLNSIQRGRRIQEELGLELHTKAGVPLHQCGIEDVKTFQRVLYLDDATFIFHEPLRVHVITSLSSSTLRKSDVCYIQLYTMVQHELFVGL
jgi:hypothetical protein